MPAVLPRLMAQFPRQLLQMGAALGDLCAAVVHLS